MTELKIRKNLIGYERVSYVKPDESTVPVKLDCSLGINPYGCAQSIIDLDKKLSLELPPYPQFPYNTLLDSLAKYWNVSPRNVRLYGGSMLALDAITRVFVAEGSKVLGFMPQFVEFVACVNGMAGVYEDVKMLESPNCKFDAEKIIAALTDEHVLVYIDNPNNPTGQVIPLAEIEKVLIAAQKTGAAVIVDEAYGDFMEDSESAAVLINKYDNLIVARSFSKGLGLASMRVGYIICSEEIMKYCDLVSFPFTVTSKAAALAEQALKEQEFLAKCRADIAKTKEKLLTEQKTLNILETDNRIPIVAFIDPKGRNLFKLLRDKGVLTEAGEDVGLDSTAVRLRVPPQADELIEIINSL